MTYISPDDATANLIGSLHSEKTGIDGAMSLKRYIFTRFLSSATHISPKEPTNNPVGKWNVPVATSSPDPTPFGNLSTRWLSVSATYTSQIGSGGDTVALGVADGVFEGVRVPEAVMLGVRVPEAVPEPVRVWDWDEDSLMLGVRVPEAVPEPVRVWDEDSLSLGVTDGVIVAELDPVVVVVIELEDSLKGDGVLEMVGFTATVVLKPFEISFEVDAVKVGEEGGVVRPTVVKVTFREPRGAARRRREPLL